LVLIVVLEGKKLSVEGPAEGWSGLLAV
jgi:hypothetical protein